MDGVTVKKLARDIKLPVDQLVDRLSDIGVEVENENDIVTGKQQLQLLKVTDLKKIKQNIAPKGELTFEVIAEAKGLRELDAMLTQLMSSQKIQPVIKEEKLGELVDVIIGLVDSEDNAATLYAASMLGRLSAVARSRESQVLLRVPELVKDELPSFDVFSDEAWRDSEKDDLGKRKNYAAISLRNIEGEWISEYCLREAVNIDTAENARRELLSIALNHFGSVADWIRAVNKQSPVVRSIDNAETRIIRARRLFSAMFENMKSWKGDLGGEPGQALAECLSRYIRGKFDDVDQEKLFHALDNILEILVRMIELRFSIALYATTYSLIEQGKRILGPGAWGRFINQSSVMPDLRIALLESALVLTRQHITDDKVMKVLIASYTSRPQVSAAIKRHFSEAHGLSPDVAEWWRSCGEIKGGRRNKSRKIGNTEDHQIGALLLEVEYSREIMEKLKRAVVPFLKISDPVLADTVTEAATRYTEMAQITRRLARMRKLSMTDNKGKRMVDYDMRSHEMVGGHRSGIRMVRIVRDGIEKNFGGTPKILVKPRVKPEDEV